MDTKSQIPENIAKLLGSSIIEDIILGVLWCKRNKGKDWCMKNFNFNTTHEQATGAEPNNFPTNDNVKKTGEKLILLGDWGILVGSICLQAVQSSWYKATTKEIVYNETIYQE